MSGSIFLLQSGSSLVKMNEAPYDSEALLQQLLAQYPDLLAGDQMDSGEPRRWLLVSREMAVPGEESGSGRWSLDHLFLDQDAIPTLLEVKRSNDTRIRREVVGQMLDYAANAVVYWPVEEIRLRFEKTCAAAGVNPEGQMVAVLGPDYPLDDFWIRVKTNLQAGRVRLVFVADEIPMELRRVVEFLNQQMDPAEVLALEVKQFVGEGQKTLVPRIIGLTAAAVTKKREWDEPMFLEALRQRRSVEEAEVARAILGWAKKHLLRIVWGRGSKDGSCFPMIDWKGNKTAVISVWTYGRVEVPFLFLKERPPFDDEAKRQELRNRLNQIPGVDIPADALALRPRILLASLTDQAALDKFLEVLDWFVKEVKAS
jgi:hypothetical protein